MNGTEKIQSFLETVTYEEKHPGSCGSKLQYPFVTISRQAGAGGHSLAVALLEAMNQKEGPLFRDWQIFDQEMCEKLISEPALRGALQKLSRTEFRSEIQDMIDEVVSQEPSQHLVLRKIFQCMHALASVGKVILLGRGGSCLTRYLPLGIHIRLMAPQTARLKRMQELLTFPPEKALAVLKERDRARAKLVQTYFMRDIDDPLLYDVIWNTARISFQEIASSMANLIELKARSWKEGEALVQERK